MIKKAYNRVELYDRNVKTLKKHKILPSKEKEIIIANFRDNIESIRRRFGLVEILNKQNLPDEAADILRFQLVYVMSSLDFFMHELYSYCLIKIFRNELPKTLKYLEIKIPLRLLEEALTNPENIENLLRNTLTEINGGYTFMSPGRLREILNNITVIDEFAIVEKRLKNRKVIPKNVRLDNIMEDIYERRNKIAHQTDIEHGTITKNPIDCEQVKRDVTIINEFVEELYKIICIGE